jgi:prepilin peptidase CpaA
MNVGYDLAALVALYTAIAAVLDYRTRKIPNWLTVSAAIVGLAYHTLAPAGLGPVAALAGFAIGFALLLLPAVLGGGGMGDVKLLAALGAWLGPLLILASFGLATVLAAFAAVAIITTSALAHVYASPGLHLPLASTPNKRRVLPFAVPVAVSTWLILGWMLVRNVAA